jgi:serine protease Do
MQGKWICPSLFKPAPAGRPGIFPGGLVGLVLVWLIVDRAAIAQPPRPGPPSSAVESAAVLEGALVEAISRAEKSVVAIARVRRSESGDEKQELDPTDPDFIPNEYASGVVVGANGLILTNYHVLGDPEKNDYFVWVQRRPYKVLQVEKVDKVVAGDPWTDLAILRIAAVNLQPVRYGDVTKLRKGMIVLVLGNPYAIARDGEASAGWGILANTGRKAAPRKRVLEAGSQRETLYHSGGLLQLDARLNLGTSGGAVLNLKGEMIGLVTAQTPFDGADRSAGFAIPTDQVFRRTVEHLKAGRKVQVGFLGVSVQPLEISQQQQGRTGVRIDQVLAGSGADRAGMRIGDVITRVDDQPVRDRNDLFHYLGGLSPETRVRFSIRRGDTVSSKGEEKQLEAVLSKRYSEHAGPAYSELADPSWRGIQVDYATAMPPLLSRQSGHLRDPLGCVAVVHVQLDSLAWKAGLRAGAFISHVGRTRVETPVQFYRLVEGLDAEVKLIRCRDDRQGEPLLVPFQ